MPRPASRASSIVAGATVIQKTGSKVLVEKVASVPITMVPQTVIASACAQRSADPPCQQPRHRNFRRARQRGKVRKQGQPFEAGNSNSEMLATKLTTVAHSYTPRPDGGGTR